MDDLTILLSADPERYWELRGQQERAGTAAAGELFRTALNTLIDAYGLDLGRSAFRMQAMSWIDLALPEPDPSRYKKERIPYPLRRAVFERDAYRCKECGDWHNLAADHIIPESKGGPTTLDNLQTLCRTCNVRKGDRL